MDTNGLTGTIPATLGNLLELEELALYSNRLEGSMPSEICALTEGALDVLFVTCGAASSDFVCDCCDVC